MRKNKMMTFRVSRNERSLLKGVASQEGHNSVSGFIMWLVKQYESGKLKRR